LVTREKPTFAPRRIWLLRRKGARRDERSYAERRAVLAPLLQRLAPREQLIVHLRFFQGMTQSEIATHLGISQMHVSRLLAKSVANLRSAADDVS